MASNGVAEPLRMLKAGEGAGVVGGVRGMAVVGLANEGACKRFPPNWGDVAIRLENGGRFCGGGDGASGFCWEGSG